MNINPEILASLSEVPWLGAEPFYRGAICRDVELYLMELTYAQAVGALPMFYRNLFTVYRAGHFPCGWGEGCFPEGFLLYY